MGFNLISLKEKTPERLIRKENTGEQAWDSNIDETANSKLFFKQSELLFRFKIAESCGVVWGHQ